MQLPPHSTVRCCKAFTLIEVLVVIAIIGILGALLLSSARGAMRSAMTAEAASKLRDLGLANRNYANDNDGYYAPAYRLTQEGYPNWNRPWCVVPEITEYFGSRNPGWTSADWPKAAKSGFKVTPNPQLGPGVMSIGYNISDYYGGLSLLFQQRTQIRMNEVSNLSDLIMFAESTDMNITYDRRAYWKEAHDSDKVSSGQSAIAYRAKGTALAVSYGGNILSLTPEQANDRNHWFVKQ